MANNPIILYSVYLVCLISHFEKLGQSDLDKKIKKIKFVENVFKSSNKPLGRFQ